MGCRVGACWLPQGREGDVPQWAFRQSNIAKNFRARAIAEATTCWSLHGGDGMGNWHAQTEWCIVGAGKVPAIRADGFVGEYASMLPGDGALLSTTPPPPCCMGGLQPSRNKMVDHAASARAVCRPKVAGRRRLVALTGPATLRVWLLLLSPTRGPALADRAAHQPGERASSSGCKLSAADDAGPSPWALVQRCGSRGHMFLAHWHPTG
jgi:hypothetical protein